MTLGRSIMLLISYSY